ncbi:SDR family NAD(P)-dependent oxidoreductase [Candidatus Palauibacter sp.]|uniref:SDR family NAD(P)-dependent oxidoreductase n=1 Tax=Candidatus Palauibacter sp. TaxID=3101350 RepID=UPI003B029A8C
MDLGLKGKVAVVTGGSRGIGLYIARALGAEGARLALCARNRDPLETAAESLRADGVADVLTVACDIAEEDGAGQLVQAAVDRYGALDVLVNNVGGNRRGKFEETSDEDWLDILQLNVLSGFRASRLAIPHMRAAGGGSIVFVSSVFGREKGGPGLSIYNTTKTALISAAGIMALELAKDAIRVNCVAPGSIQFPGGSWDKRVQSDPEGMRKFVDANLPLGRFGRADEVADVVTFLASERASLITGACIAVDGSQGRSLV